ncbi:MAG: alcohol dehydrogenase catalytic domain-containing protein [Candidatus Tectomicrobia bacterium]|nr:alcohol dehydrogenase catalytic domain-containing protein [Candidatus Tectomicrobia bacterium]
MAKKTTSAVVEKIGEMRLREYPVPELHADDGLLKVEMVGICRTDPSIFYGKVQAGGYPVILGHEILGRVAAAGDLAAQRWGVQPGDRVIVENFVPCGFCKQCRLGHFKHCLHLIGYGTLTNAVAPPHLWGGYGEHMYLAPNSVLHKMPDDLPAEACALTPSVLANAYEWVHLMGRVQSGDIVVIEGVGQQGLCATIVARECGARTVIVTGLTRDARRFELARRFGADYCIDIEKEDLAQTVRDITGGDLANVVVEVTGDPRAVSIAADLAAPLGTIVAAGLSGTETVTPLFLQKLQFKELRLLGVLSSGTEAHTLAANLVRSRKYPIEDIVDQRYGLEEAQQAVETVAGKVSGLYPSKTVLDLRS